MLNENQLAKLRENEIILNADIVKDMSDADIIKIVRHELNHYRMGQYMAFHPQARERVRSAVLSGELTPMDETGEKTSEEIYAELLAESKNEGSMEYNYDTVEGYIKKYSPEMKELILSKELVPVDDMAQFTSDEIYNAVLAEDQRIKENAKKNI